jgi:phospholipase/lecithinase/hemolysin
MSSGFNAALQQGLAGTVVRVVDAYTVSRDQLRRPEAYGATNATTPACDLTPQRNPFGSSLVCNAGNVIAGDTSRYIFADSVHPTPYGYKLLADLVYDEIGRAGWR